MIRNKLKAQQFITFEEYNQAVAEIRAVKRGDHKALQNEIYDLCDKLTASKNAGHPGAEYNP